MVDVVQYEVRKACAWITLARPLVMNALNAEVKEALSRLVRIADADSAAKVIVIRGSGGRAFSAGADIKEFGPVTSAFDNRAARLHYSWIRAIDEARKPVIASIEGFCLGGGLEIALACDIRIADKTALFGFPETGLGVMTGVGGSQRIVQVLGLGRAMDLALTGERLNADRAFAVGLVSRLVEAGELQQATEQLVDLLTTKAPLAMISMKEAIKAAWDLTLRDGIRLEADLLTHLMNSDDRLEAARAFKERRAPQFSGK